MNKKRLSTSSAIEKKSAAMVDSETFGGVITNLEKLLSPRQKKSFVKSLKAKKVKNNTGLVLKRKSAITGDITTAAITVTTSRGQKYKESSKRGWSQGFLTPSMSNTRNSRGVALTDTCFNPQPKAYSFDY